MDCLLVTPESEADLQLLTTLFKKMKIKAEEVPARAASTKAPKRTKAASAAAGNDADKLLPRTQAERNLVGAIEELKEIQAGRKQAMSLRQFLDELE
jgi:hypothetical protein